MAKDLGTRILGFLLEKASASNDAVQVADLAAHFRVTVGDVQDELLLLDIEGLVQEVPGLRKDDSTYIITDTGRTYLMRAT